MSFYGKDPEPPPSSAEKKTFYYRNSRHSEPQKVVAHNVYFYDSGHIGFWNDKEGGDRTLVLAVRANEVWEETE